MGLSRASKNLLMRGKAVHKKASSLIGSYIANRLMTDTIGHNIDARLADEEREHIIRQREKRNQKW